MSNKYDVIVVGAGNAGLVAGATTAKAGLNTLVLEKHNVPGGAASSFKRGRFEIEPSLHELCSVGNKEKPGEIYNIFSRLGAKVDWRYEFSTFRAVSPTFDVKLRAGKENFIEDLEKVAPNSRGAVEAIFDIVEGNNKALEYVDKKKGNPNPLVMALKHADFLRSASHSAEEVEKALGMSEKARDIFNNYWCYLGIPTDELNALHYFTMVTSYVNMGAAMPYKRSHEMSCALEKVILDNGGQVWYNSEVVEFIYGTQGSVDGVKLADGKKLYAKQIISNVIPHNVYAMSKSKCVPDRELKLANARTFGISFITVYLGLDASKEELGITDYTVFKMSESNPRKQYEAIKADYENAMYYVVNCLNVAIPDCTPEGTCSLFLTIPMFGNQLPEDLTAENYKEFKNRIAKKYIRDYEEYFNVDIMSHIEEIEIATPVTFARYLGTPEGEVYGYETNGWDNIINRIQSKQKDFTVKNLTYCGGFDSRGDGYSSAYINGEQAGKIAINRIKGGAE